MADDNPQTTPDPDTERGAVTWHSSDEAALIQRATKITADHAWTIAHKGKAPPEVCLAIESLSDDPERNQRLIAEIMQP